MQIRKQNLRKFKVTSYWEAGIPIPKPMDWKDLQYYNNITNDPFLTEVWSTEGSDGMFVHRMVYVDGSRGIVGLWIKGLESDNTNH